MNYFEFYAGDYGRDTAHLSLAEHGAFLLLLSAYYSTERALPASCADLFRIARAMSPAEQKAVKSVANQFFPVGDDGLRHNGRCDAELSKAQKRIDTARDNGKRGGRPVKVKAEAIPTDNPAGNPLGSSWDAGSKPAGKAPHTPHANYSVGRTETSTEHLPEPTAAGRACLLMRQAGCVQSNPSHPALIAALSEGVTPETLGHTAREGVEQGKNNPFPWAITTARSRHAQGAQPINGVSHANSTPSRKPSVVEQAENAIRERRQRESGGGFIAIGSG